MTSSAKDLQFRELKDTISELNKTNRALLETITALNKRIAEMAQEHDNQKEQIDFLTKKLFGRSSEKDINIPGQLNLFNEAEVCQDLALLAKDELEAAAAPPLHRKKKATMEDHFKGLPVSEVLLDIPEAERICDRCGTPLVKVGKTFVRREFCYVPAKGKVIEYYSVNYKCPVCEETNGIPYIIKGSDGHPHMLHGMASASTVAWVMYQKYSNCMPLYRMESDLKLQLGIDIGRATLANWVISNASDLFTPIYDMMHRRFIARTFIMADETPVQVLKEPDRRAETRSFMWVYHTGENDGPPIILYKYSETRSGSNASDFLKGFKGYLMCDGYSGYNKVPNIIRTSCWAHARRYLIDAIPKGKKDDLTQPSVQGVMYINKLFTLEDVIHSKHKDTDGIKEERLQKEKPILEAFWSWLEMQDPAKGSRMYKAVIYIAGHKETLMNYLKDGHCSFTNNASERSVKPFVMGRKNWLFADTPNGADASAMCYSMIETAKANGVNPYYYLCYLLEHCPNSQMTDDELGSMAPWNKDVQDHIQRQAEEAQRSST